MNKRQEERRTPSADRIEGNGRGKDVYFFLDTHTVTRGRNHSCCIHTRAGDRTWTAALHTRPEKPGGSEMQAHRQRCNTENRQRPFETIGARFFWALSVCVCVCAVCTFYFRMPRSHRPSAADRLPRSGRCNCTALCVDLANRSKLLRSLMKPTSLGSQRP